MSYLAENQIIQKTDFQDYRSDLERVVLFLLRQRIDEDSVLNPEIVTGIRRLEFLARDDRRSLFGHKGPWFFDLVSVSRELYGRWETLLEFREARQLIHKKNQEFFTQNDQISRTFCFAKEEGKFAEVTKDSRVAFIGSGPFHESAIAIASSFGCSVDCFDYNREAVNLSRELNRKLNLGSRIKIFHNSAIRVDFSRYDVVWMAVLTKDKESVLNRIFDTSPNAVVVCRSVDGAKNLLYEGVSSQITEKHREIKKVVASNRKTIMHSLILQR